MALSNQSNLPTFQGFKYENYPGAEEWFAQFLQSLNLFVLPVYNILNGGVTYQNLTVPQTYSTTITSPASGNVTFNFSNPLRIAPTAVILGNIYQGTTRDSHPANPAVVYWHYSQGVIYVDNITNLDASTQYTLSLVVL